MGCHVRLVVDVIQGLIVRMCEDLIVLYHNLDPLVCAPEGAGGGRRT